MSVIAHQRTSIRNVFVRNTDLIRDMYHPLAFGFFHLKKKIPVPKRDLRSSHLLFVSGVAKDGILDPESKKTLGQGEDQNIVKRKKKRKNKNSRDKRREFIGKAKAVDRGQWSAVYSPGGKDCNSFTAKSGLPDRKKPFIVLGIESSCDDTGGKF